jgi:hypothetical protein
MRSVISITGGIFSRTTLVEDQHALVCEYAQGVWRLSVDGEKMDGTLTRPDGSLQAGGAA